MALPVDTRIGAVRLRVADLDRVRSFYERTIGLSEVEGRNGDIVALGAGGKPLIELVHDPDAPPRPPGTTGLFHLAILVPDRHELARALKRLADNETRLTGAADHLVSEALYLDDPEGNGIEIYRDRPREEWKTEEGELAMATLPLDLRSVVEELSGPDDGSPQMADGTTIGHVHLEVAQVDAAEEFWVGEIGLDVTVRGYPGALFVSAGGYHHHIGLNTWASEGGAPPPPGSRGLVHFELEVPGADGQEEKADPDENRVLVRPPAAS